MGGSCVGSTHPFSPRPLIQPRWGLSRRQVHCWRNGGKQVPPILFTHPHPGPCSEFQGLAPSLLREQHIRFSSETNTIQLRCLNSKTITDGLCARTSLAEFRKLLYHWDFLTDKKNFHSILSWKERTPNTGFCSRHRSKTGWDCARGRRGK